MKYEVKVKLEEVCGISVFDDTMMNAKILGQVSSVVGFSRNKCGIMSQPSLPLRERINQIDDQTDFGAIWHKESDALTLETKLNNYRQKTFEVSIMLSRGSERILIGVASLKFISTVFETEVNIPIHLIGSPKAVEISYSSKTRGQKKFLGKYEDKDSFFQSNPYTINDGVRTVCFKGGDSKRRYGLIKGAYIKLKCSCIPTQKVNLKNFESLINENYWYHGGTVPSASSNTDISRERNLSQDVSRNQSERRSQVEEETDEAEEAPSISRTIVSTEHSIFDEKSINIDNAVTEIRSMESILEIASEESESIDHNIPKEPKGFPQSDHNVWNNMLYSISDLGKNVEHKLQIQRIRVEKLCFSFGNSGCMEPFSHMDNVNIQHDQRATRTGQRLENQVQHPKHMQKPNPQKISRNIRSIPSTIDVINSKSIDISEIQVLSVSAGVEKLNSSSSDANTGGIIKGINSETTNEAKSQVNMSTVPDYSESKQLHISTDHINCNQNKYLEIDTPGTTALYVSKLKSATSSNNKITPRPTHEFDNNSDSENQVDKEDIEKQNSFGTTALGSLLGVDISEVKKASMSKSVSKEEKLHISLDTYQVKRGSGSQSSAYDSLLGSKASSNHSVSQGESFTVMSKSHSDNEENKGNPLAFMTSPKSQTTSSHSTYTSFRSFQNGPIEGRAVLSPTSRTNYGSIL